MLLGFILFTLSSRRRPQPFRVPAKYFDAVCRDAYGKIHDINVEVLRVPDVREEMPDFRLRPLSPMTPLLSRRRRLGMDSGPAYT